MKKYIAYYRVSRKEQGISGLGLAAQKSTVEKFIQAQKGFLEAAYTEVETGTSKRERIEIHKAIEKAKREKAVLVIAKLDRLSRNVGFVSSLLDSNVEFIAVDMPSANNFTIHIFAAMAQQEAELISLRTSHALAELKKKGIKLGKPENLTTEARKRGVEAIKANAKNNNNNRQSLSVIKSCKEKGMSYRDIADYLNELSFVTRHGNKFFPNTVRQLLYAT